MSTVTLPSLSEYFGFDPKSQYADLFTQIYHLTKPVLEDDIEDGEISDDDKHAKKTHDTDVGLISDEDDEKPTDLSVTSKSSAPDNRVQFSKQILHWNHLNRQNQNLWSGEAKLLPPPLPFQPHLPPPLTSLPPPPVTSLVTSLPPPMLPPLSLPPLSLVPTSQLNSSVFSAPPTIPFPFPLGFPAHIPPPPTSAAFNPFMPPGLSALGAGFSAPPPVSQPSQLNILQPVINNVTREEQEMQESKGFDLKTLFDIDPSPARVDWMMEYLEFMTSRGSPLTKCPALNKEPLDLFKLFSVVMAEGGFNKVTVSKSWKRVSVKIVNVKEKQHYLWRMCEKLYRKYLLPFEIQLSQGKFQNIKKFKCQ